MRRVILAVAAFTLAACSGGGTGSSSGSTGSGSTGTTVGSTGGTSSGSGGTTGGTTGTTGSAQAFCTNAYPLICQVYKNCGYVDPAMDCTQLFAGLDATCGSQYQQFSSSAASSCLSALQTAVNGGNCDVFNNGSSVDQTCSQVFAPSVPEGGTCSSSEDCVPRADGGSVQCKKTTSSCTGTCSAGAALYQACPDYDCAEGYCDYASGTCQPYLPVGGDCSQGQQCDPSTGHCSYNAADGGQSCAPLSGTGTLCYSSTDCVSTDYCQTDGGYSGGACQPAGSTGQPCHAVSTYESDCQQGLVCLNGTCRSQTANPGDPCGPQVYCSDSTCSSTDGGVGSCVAYAQFGQSCAGATCEPGFGLYCDGGVCAGLPTSGQPCASSSAGETCRYGDFCAGGTCQLRGGAGSSCTTADPRSCSGSWCASSNTCQAYLSAGAPCNPQLFQCSGRTGCTYSMDGGSVCGDALCQSPDGGPTVCVTGCP